MGHHYTHLSPEERGAIQAWVGQGLSARQIARELQRAQSTITRELRRNGCRPRNGRALIGRPRKAPGYDAAAAQQRAVGLRQRPRRPRKLRTGTALWSEVLILLRAGWSPQQASLRLRRRHPDNPAWHVSHETVYTALYAMPRGELRRQLLLRRKRAARRPQRRALDGRGRMTDLPSIHDRPPEVEERLLPGHWEGDLIKGARNQSSVGVLVCRQTLFVMLVRLPDATAQGVLEGFTRAFARLPPRLRKTLTYDQGKEMALHRELSKGLGLKVYFADPHSPWQRGRCENTNGLLRQYLPKGTDLSVHSQRDLDRIAWRLNMRPRVSMDVRMPAEVFLEKLYGRPVDFSTEDVIAVG